MPGYGSLGLSGYNSRPSAEMSRGVVKRAGGNSRIILCAGGPNTYEKTSYGQDSIEMDGASRS